MSDSTLMSELPPSSITHLTHPPRVSFHLVSHFCLLKCYSIYPSQTVPHIPLSILPQLSHLFLSTSCLPREVTLLFQPPRCSSWRQEKEGALAAEDGERVCPGEAWMPADRVPRVPAALQSQWEGSVCVHQEPVTGLSLGSRTPRSR